MQALPLRPLSAPSPTLLRFLKAQARHLAASSPFPGVQCCAESSAIRHASTSRRLNLPLLPPPSAPHDRASGSVDTSWHSPSSGSSFHPLHSPFSHRPAIHEASHSAQSTRSLSTSSPLSRFWNLWPGFKRKSKPPLRPNDLPPLSGFLDENSTTGRVLKSGNELKLRCTEFDENGSVTLVNGEFKKSELIAKYGLLPRDLRKIDSSLLPHILIRPSAILLNLLHLRVLIKHNRVLVFDAYGTTDSYTQSVFMYDLEGKLRQSNDSSMPYEFRALEAVLISVTSGLESEFEGVAEPVVRVLRELEEDIDRDKLRYLLIYSKKLGTFEQKARLVRDALEELLEADDDLAAMYLTEKAKGHARGEAEHTEVEMLLESYHKVGDEIVQSAENLVSNIRNTEEIVKAILDANRNSLMLLELRFSIWTLGLGAGTFIAALYGMNLKNFIEESDIGFWGVSGVCALLSTAVLAYGLQRLRKVQRVSMWGEVTPAVGRHNNWGRKAFNEVDCKKDGVGPIGSLGRGAGTAGLGALGPLESRAEKLRRHQQAKDLLGKRRRTVSVDT